MEGMKLFISDELPDLIVDIDGIRVATSYADNRATRAAICERIIRCWNFFEGTETEDIPKR